MILSVTILLIFFIPSVNKFILKILALSASGITLILSLFLLIEFNCETFYFQEIVYYKLGSHLLNLNFLFGLDGISVYFFVLTTFLFFICLLFIWNEFYIKEYVLCLLIIEFLLLLVFSVLDLLLFYVFFWSDSNTYVFFNWFMGI